MYGAKHIGSGGEAIRQNVSGGLLLARVPFF